MRFQVAILATLLISVSAVGVGRTQSSGAKGVLMCNDKPDAHVTVKLYDDDRGIDADDLLASTKTDARGQFSISGHTSEITNIDPKLTIFTDCNDGIKPCQRKITVKIPDRYITDGKVAKTIYDAGVIQLAGKFPGEERDCLH